MTNYEKIKSMTIDELAVFIRYKCLISKAVDLVDDVTAIKEWLEREW